MVTPLPLANDNTPVFGVAKPVVPTTVFNEVLALLKPAVEYTPRVLA